MAWIVDLSDMGYDKGVGGMDLGFCLILLGFLKIGNKVGFFSWCVDKSAMWMLPKCDYYFSFKYPPIIKNNG